MANTWERVDEQQYRCTQCVDAPLFDPAVNPHRCPAGSSGVLTEELGRSESVRTDTETPGLPAAAVDPDSESDPGYSGVPIASVPYWMRRAAAVAEAARRLRLAASKLPIEDEHTTSEDGRRGVWREAWRAAHSRHNEQVKALELERKATISALEATIRWDDPELAEQRQMIAEFKRIKAGQRVYAEDN